MPDEMAGFRQYAAWIASHASDPDRWKSNLDDERYRHYIDLDRYGEYPFSNIPHNLEKLVNDYGRRIVSENGVLPWTIENKYNRLVCLMRAGEWEKALYVASALGHYVGDAHQPFHATGNFDGQNTDNAGIHSRYESQMTLKYQDEIKWTNTGTLSAGAVTAIPVIIDLAFEYLTESYRYIEKITDADTKYKKFLENDEDKYYKMLWKDTGAFTRIIINKAAEDLSRLYFFAWVEAGRPVIPKIDPAELADIKNFRQWREIFYESTSTAKLPTTLSGEEQDPGHPDYVAHPPIVP